MERYWRKALMFTIVLGCAGCEQQTRIEPVAAGTQCRQFNAPLTQDPALAPNYGTQCLMPGSQWVIVSSNSGAARNLVAPLGTLYPAPADTYWIADKSNLVWPHIFTKGDDPAGAFQNWNGTGIHASQ